VPPSTLDTLAESLLGTFPGSDDPALARMVVRELAKGEPVVASALPEGANAAFARWPNVEYDDQRRVVAFSGLSLAPTSHRFTVAGRRLYTWCAWDTLFLPAVLDQSADVRSSCPITGAVVRLTVDPIGIRHAEPDVLGLSFPPPTRRRPPTSREPSAAMCTSSPDRLPPHDG
jgi:alkylmercury lyase